MAKIADRLGVTTTEAALGVLQIQKYGMTQSIELNSVRRGYDPREFTLVAAGGAGPLFACDIALELEIPRVLVPPHPGNHVGDGPARDRRRPRVRGDDDDAAAPPRRGAARAHLRRARGAGDRASSPRTATRATARSSRGSRTAATQARATRCVSRRPAVPLATDDWVARTTEAFHRGPRARVRPALRRRDRHRQRPRRPASASCRRSSGRRPRPQAGAPEPAFERDVVFELDGSATGRARHPSTTATSSRAGQTIAGPAVIEQYDSTTVDPARA